MSSIPMLAKSSIITHHFPVAAVVVQDFLILFVRLFVLREGVCIFLEIKRDITHTKSKHFVCNSEGTELTTSQIEVKCVEHKPTQSIIHSLVVRQKQHRKQSLYLRLEYENSSKVRKNKFKPAGHI